MWRSSRSFPLAMAVALAYVSSLSAQGWTNAGTQSVITDWPTTAGTRYVTPGQSLIFRVDVITENDTYTPMSGAPAQYDDPQKEAKLSKTGGTVSGTWSTTFSAPGFYTYNVPSDATAGQTIEIKLELHDTRAAGDARHDDWTTITTWTFTVTTACPDNIVTDAVAYDTPPAAGTTDGQTILTKKATGAPPAPRTNWNGTLITEVVGPSMPDNSANWRGPWQNGLANQNDSTFLVGSAGDNKFNDYLRQAWGDLSLAVGVDVATRTSSHVYKCSSTKTYGFTDTTTHTRKKDAPGERVLVTVAQN